MTIWRCIVIAYTLAVVTGAAFGITSRFEVAALAVALGVAWWTNPPRKNRPGPR